MRATRTILAAAFTAALLPAVPAAAHPHVPHYRLVDIGTFGGPNAEINGPARVITSRGAVLGSADTGVPNEDYPNDPLCGNSPYIKHGFSYRNGRLTDLGALPGNNCSGVFEVNRHGLGGGVSETVAIDPRADAPASHPVLFRHGKVIDIGTLPGGSEGFAFSVNDRGQVLGVSNTDLPGPDFPEFFSRDGQIQSFLWQDGRMRDIGC